AGFLARAGLDDVQVYEQAGALGEIGAGIQVPPNAVRLLHRLVVVEQLDDAGVRLEGVVHVGKRCAAVEETGEEVQVTFDDGETITADVVIGADGIHSVVRGAVTTPSPPTFSGLA